jgi:GntR family transcriptional regulator
MQIDKKSRLPAYIQLKNILVEKIHKKELLPGDPLLSERDLAAKTNLSRMTVRQTFKALESEGLIHREKGRGTFVSRPSFEQKDIMSFTELVKSKGAKPASRILCFETKDPDDNIRELFDIHEKNSFFHFKRLRLADLDPVAIEEIYIPRHICPTLTLSDLETSLYSVLKEKYGHTVTYVDSTITASMPECEQQKLLDIPGNIPLIGVSGINYNQLGKKIYYEISYYRSDEYKYNIHINLY